MLKDMNRDLEDSVNINDKELKPKKGNQND